MQQALERRGWPMVGIGMGTHRALKSFKSMTHFPGDLYTDETEGLPVFRKLGARARASAPLGCCARVCQCLGGTCAALANVCCYRGLLGALGGSTQVHTQGGVMLFDGERRLLYERMFKAPDEPFPVARLLDAIDKATPAT